MINHYSAPVSTVVSEHKSSPDVVTNVVAAGAVLLLAFLSCFIASTGNRFLPPQRLHVTTSTSAQGFLPPFTGVLDDLGCSTSRDKDRVAAFAHGALQVDSKSQLTFS